jgi:tetratricopeptide (TPR) repeat protein
MSRWGARQAEKQPDSLDVLFDYEVASAFLLEIDPAFGTSHGELAFLAQARGNQGEAVAEFEATEKADPNDLSNSAGLAQMLIPAGNAARAKEVLEGVIARDRNARAYGGRSALTIYGWALWELREREAASRVFDDVLGRLAAREQSGETSYQLYRERAAIHAVRGNRAEALRAARLAVENGWHLYASWQMPDPMFRSLSGDAEFEALLDRMRAEVRVLRQRAGLPAK